MQVRAQSQSIYENFTPDDKEMMILSKTQGRFISSVWNEMLNKYLRSSQQVSQITKKGTFGDYYFYFIFLFLLFLFFFFFLIFIFFFEDGVPLYVISSSLCWNNTNTNFEKLCDKPASYYKAMKESQEDLLSLSNLSKLIVNDKYIGKLNLNDPTFVANQILSMLNKN